MESRRVCALMYSENGGNIIDAVADSDSVSTHENVICRRKKNI